MIDDNILKKEFKKKDVERARNLIKKDYGAATEIKKGYEKQDVDRKEGEVWEEDGKTWTIEDGVKFNITKLDSAKNEINVPLSCPNCGNSMSHHLSKKMWRIHKMCFDCVVDMESKLRRIGKYEEYENMMVKGGILDWVEDLDNFIKDRLNEETSIVTEDGQKETWNNISKSHKDEILKQLEKYKDYIYSKVGDVQSDDT